MLDMLIAKIQFLTHVWNWTVGVVVGVLAALGFTYMSPKLAAITAVAEVVWIIVLLLGFRWLWRRYDIWIS